MLERPDVVALHEPLEGLVHLGPTQLAGRRFEAPQELLDWLVGEADRHVFLKETLAPAVVELVRAHDLFLAQARHSFLIRRPEEIAASFLALEGDLRIHESGIRALYDLFETVRGVGGQAIVVDSDDLVMDPEATMRAYCDAVGLPFRAEALRWEPGVRREWERTARWHRDASASSGFVRPTASDRHGLATHPDVVEFVTHHQPFYERLWRQRLRVDTSRRR